MYNDEDENGVEEEENYEDEYEQEEQYSGYNSSKPPLSNNPVINLKNKAGKAGRDAAKRAGKAVFQAVKSLVMFLVSNPMILAVIIIFVILAMIWLVLAEELTKKVTTSVDKYILNSTTIDSTAKDLYVNRHSLLLLKISEINEIYDSFVSDKSVTGDIRRAMKIKVGKNNVEKKKATQPKNPSSGSGSSSGSSGSAITGTFTPGNDGVRSDERVKIITGSTNPISSYMTGGMYVHSNGSIGGVKVDIVDVTIPVWKGSGDNKTESTASLQVNSKIKDTVEAIFKEIHADPSKPVINEIGCFRASYAYPGHPFGTAIDINPNSNPQIKEGDYVGGTYAPGSDPLSMDANHAIVKVFTGKYGWDWGGNWSGFKDYMHFSFMGG